MLLTPTDVRALVNELGLRPAKALGQNFMVDPAQVRRIVAAAHLAPGERVLEIGPGLGSLTLALLEAGMTVTAVEIDPLLATALPTTIASRHQNPQGDGDCAYSRATTGEGTSGGGHTASSELRAPGLGERLTVLTADALELAVLPPPPPTALVANLPYGVATKVLLRCLERLASIRRGLVMVQAEVADRLVAAPGSRVYGIPSVKAAWWASARLAGRVPRSAFFPVPRVDSALVYLERRPAPAAGAERRQVFAVVDAAFAARRKTLRAALAGLAGGSARAEAALRAAGIDPMARGETLDVAAFGRLAAALAVVGAGSKGSSHEAA
ncbi:MAG: 16S rRNA (adenine(1518)-N(6)/adenine(1519)-N(6))-dimethyltransferase [Bifidobacteriaceae bacterium]|nr:16S rRNA (adenine(1518)-N(6)/adenine(1519)-N(6))-dimethyltransferase [Bifidobacteriaceae bacterium]